MFTFIRIPKSGSTSVMASIASYTASFDHRHRTVSQILEDGQDHKFYAIVRDPLQQYCSMYYHARQMLDLDINENPMMDAFMEHIAVIRQYPELEDYLLHAPQNDFLGKYLSGMDPEDLACVGRLDMFEESLQLITRITGMPTMNVWLKRNPEGSVYTVSDSVQKAFMQNNEQEYMLYNKSLSYFNKLIS